MTSDPVCFWTMPSRRERPASRTCWREHAEAAHHHQVLYYSRAYPVGSSPHELVLEGHHVVADGGLDLALSAFHERVTAPPLGVRQRRRPVPHRTSTPLEGTQSLALNPLASPGVVPEGAAET